MDYGHQIWTASTVFERSAFGNFSSAGLDWHYYLVPWFWSHFFIYERTKVIKFRQQVHLLGKSAYRFLLGAGDLLSWPHNFDKSSFFPSWISSDHEIWTAGKLRRKESPHWGEIVQDLRGLSNRYLNKWFSLV